MTAEEDAFQKGYRDSQTSLTSTSLSARAYAPPPGLADAYAAGWQKAAAEAGDSVARGSRRSDIVGAFVIGGILLGGGVGLTVFSIASHGGLVVVAGGMIIGGATLIFKGIRAVAMKREVDA